MSRIALSFLCLTFASSCVAMGAKSVTYYYSDPQGNVLATTDQNGNIISTRDYRPYGQSALGSAEQGLGYTGHVEDADTSFVYMQARYYDPIVGRFVSIDPKPPKPGDIFGFSRYLYVDGNPLTRVDPTGEVGLLFWTAKNQVTYTTKYVVGTTDGAQLPVSHAQISDQIAHDFSGTVRLGSVAVTVVAQAMEASSASGPGTSNFINVVPDTQGVTGTGRAETNAVGGDRITVAATGPYQVGASAISHELGGHAGGAGDQYIGGTAANGSTVTTEPPGASGVMKVLNAGPANEQALREILQSSSNINTCAPGVEAGNGRC